MVTEAQAAGRTHAQEVWNRACDILRSMHPAPSQQELALLPLITAVTQFENIIILGVPDAHVRAEVENLMNSDLQKVLAIAAGMPISYVLRVDETTPHGIADPGAIPSSSPSQTVPSSFAPSESSSETPSESTASTATTLPGTQSTTPVSPASRTGLPLEQRPLPPVADSMHQSHLFDLPTTKQRERLLRNRQAQQAQQAQQGAQQTRTDQAPSAQVAQTTQSQQTPQNLHNIRQAQPASQTPAAVRDIAPAATVTGPRTNSVTISSAATDPETRLNPEQTFDTFVSGQSNRFARTAAYQVAESPGTAYNPLFVYANSGLGKTHLLNAIGNYALALQPNLRVRYVNSEHFTNEFINAVRNGSGNNNGINAFNEKYRDVDMLLIDDIQFLGGKTETLEQFFHTFNALTTAKKQIVIASDVAPKRLKGFEERIVSRFDGGLTVNMDEPSIETRIAILRMKAQQLLEQARRSKNGHPVSVPEDVLNLIATQVTGNIRELEGALIRIVAMSSLSNQPVTQQLAQQTLQDYVVKDIQHSPMDIIRRTASYFGLQPNDIVSAKRSKKIAMSRQIAMYLCREMTPLSLTAIGEIFGGRDHTTVIHAYKKISREMTQKREVYNYVNTLTTELKNPSDDSKNSDE